MFLCHRIGPRLNSNFNRLDEILAADGPISFDGIYTELLQYIPQLQAKPQIYLFFSGAHVGRDNRFDRGQPFGQFCDWPEIRHLVQKLNAKLGYHSLTHRDLTAMSDEDVVKEITPPFSMDFFAYPHGRVDARVARLVKNAGYKAAWAAGPHGDGSQYQLKRWYINW